MIGVMSGAMLAVLAAVSFGMTTPVMAVAGRGVGALGTAALLYAGAALSGLVLGASSSRGGARLGRAQLGRLLLVGLFGAAVAPTLLAWGVQRVGATTGSLLLNMEAVGTVLLARAFYRESIGRRVWVALSLMVGAGILLAFDSARSATWSVVGVLAVGGATAAWAVDNTLTRPLSEFDAASVVTGKGAVGAALTGTLALVLGEPLPTAGRTLALLACGATGYGLSLRLYLVAQRRIGAARTGSIFALAPFVGAATAWLVGGRPAGLLTAASATLFAGGVFLHLTERHRHWHRHQPVTHEHAHRHDDGHHEHAHQPPVAGEHTHAHRHERLEHDHDHAPDLHHRDHQHDHQA